VILILEISAGLAPGGHSCVTQSSHLSSGLQVKPAPSARHLERGDLLCVACLLQAQFSSISLSVVPQVLPPQDSIIIGTERDPLPTCHSQLHWDARAPPYASSDSSTT
jgi:hypothetical protein